MKPRIFKADLSSKENKAVTELELEAQCRAQDLLERASALQIEQDEEIRMLNRVGSVQAHRGGGFKNTSKCIVSYWQSC